MPVTPCEEVSGKDILKGTPCRVVSEDATNVGDAMRRLHAQKTCGVVVEQTRRRVGELNANGNVKHCGGGAYRDVSENIRAMPSVVLT